ncbi:hypothetical protein R3P38DRAFT_2968836 [Favolaschia claudopus]|uniref:Uncharacterized protein n=1 Tax=Favolaschia claudopus TaxID=2862362 RepID=A0AAW0B2W6_9AGAR
MASFTPTSPIDMASERDWANNLGMLDWDSTSIVFTKRSLLDFLKTIDVTVDTNFQNISKLPRYAKFGKISDADGLSSTTPSKATPAPATASEPASTSSPNNSNSDFKPSRRVRDPPGGPRTNIFADADEDAPDALSSAPAQLKAALPDATDPTSATDAPSQATPEGPKPSRRVREAPGGNSTLGRIWGNDEVEEFKPTRRVRQVPGGNVTGLF